MRLGNFVVDENTRLKLLPVATVATVVRSDVARVRLKSQCLSNLDLHVSTRTQSVPTPNQSH